MPTLQQNIDLAKRLTIHQTERQFSIVTDTDRKIVESLKLITMDVQVAKSNPLTLNVNVDFSLLNMHYQYNTKITLTRQHPDATFLQGTLTEVLINGMLDLFTQPLTDNFQNSQSDSHEDAQQISFSESIFDLYLMLAIVNQAQIRSDDQSSLVEQYMSEHKDDNGAKNFTQPWFDYYQELDSIDLNNPTNAKKLINLLMNNPVADWTDTFSKFKELIDETDVTDEMKQTYNNQTGDHLNKKQFSDLCLKFIEEIYGQPIMHVAYYFVFSQYYDTIKKANELPDSFTDLTNDQVIGLQDNLLVNTLPINVQDQINWLVNNQWIIVDSLLSQPV